MRHLYGVFTNKQWGMTTRKVEAIKVAKNWKAVVRVMPYPGGDYAWDAPTFRVCSDLLADYRGRIITVN